MTSTGSESLIRAIVDGDQTAAVNEVENLLAQGVSRQEIVTDGIEKAMESLDNRCTAEQYNLLELMLAGRAVDATTRVLFAGGFDPENCKGKVVVAALEGDIHDLGKTIVKKVLAGSGYLVVDCGKDTTLVELVNTAKRENADAVCISGLITNVIPQVQIIKLLLDKAGLGKVKVLAGGAALKQSSPAALKVDHVGETAFDVVHYLNSNIGERP